MNLKDWDKWERGGENPQAGKLPRSLGDGGRKEIL